MTRADLLLILAWLLALAALPDAQTITREAEGIYLPTINCLPYIDSAFNTGIVVGACGSIILFTLFTWLHGVAISRRSYGA